MNNKVNRKSKKIAYHIKRMTGEKMLSYTSPYEMQILHQNLSALIVYSVRLQNVCQTHNKFVFLNDSNNLNTK